MVVSSFSDLLPTWDEWRLSRRHMVGFPGDTLSHTFYVPCDRGSASHVTGNDDHSRVLHGLEVRITSHHPGQERETAASLGLSRRLN